MVRHGARNRTAAMVLNTTKNSAYGPMHGTSTYKHLAAAFELRNGRKGTILF
jgi:hypothetical protein